MYKKEIYSIFTFVLICLGFLLTMNITTWYEHLGMVLFFFGGALGQYASTLASKKVKRKGSG